MDDHEELEEITPEPEPDAVRPDGPRVSAPPSPGRTPLRRRVHGRVLGGVAGGLANHYGVSELGMRIAFGGAGVVVAFLVLRPFTGLPPGLSSVTYLPQFSFLRSLVTLVSGLGVMAYGALWVLVPQEGAPASSAARMRRRLPRAPG